MAIAYGFDQPVAFFGNINIKPVKLDFKESHVHIIREEGTATISKKPEITENEIREKKKFGGVLTLINVLERSNDWDCIMMKEKTVESRDDIPINVRSSRVRFNPTISNKNSKKLKSSKKLVKSLVNFNKRKEKMASFPKSLKVTAKKHSENARTLVFEGVDENLPSGWTKKVFRRNRGLTKSRQDTYWFSPRMKKQFRSKAEVKRFIDCLRRSDGDEVAAYAAFKSI